ncbi:MAG: S8 family serine peptidase, partial [Rhodospirillales bacterium]
MRSPITTGPRRRRAARALAPFALALMTQAAFAETPPDGRADPAALMRFAIAQACEAPIPEGAEPGPVLAERFGGATLLEARTFEVRGRPGKARFGLLLENGDEVRIERLFPLGTLRRVTVEYHREVAKDTVRPAMSAATGADCRVLRAARIDYDADGGAETLVLLGADLTDVLAREPLNPPVPAGRDPGGVAVAHVDTGVNYLLPGLSGRLARDENGRLLGFDFWDMDGRPFDVDTARSPFFPLHHGTAVASILLREAPAARLVPYRYPRPEMARFADLVKHADAQGAVVVIMAMGSNKREDWTAFADAAAERPHMLFVISAGNDGRDIDERPVYPAALGLGNFLVVTS